MAEFTAHPEGTDAHSAKVHADRLKDEGNQFFNQQHYHEAIDKYTAALAILSDAVYYSNRAQAYIKAEEYGLAIEDANEAIRLNPTYEKAYFRRASAKFGLLKFNEAKVDFEKVLEMRPGSPEAYNKHKECVKILKSLNKQAYLDAMHFDAAPTIDTGAIDRMVVEASYKGPRLENEAGEFFINRELALQVMDWFKDQKLLHKKYTMKLLLAAGKLFQTLPTLVRVPLPRNDGKIGEITVCGDTHGQYYDLCNIFSLNGLPSAENPYLFNGDFVDRGSFSLEVIMTLLAWKLVDPNCMHLTRGNHETRAMNKIYGFEGEVLHKCDNTIMTIFTDVFNWLPLAAVIENKVFVVHGGISTMNDGEVPLSSIERIDRNQEPPQGGLMSDLLWADPHPGVGKIPSKRGMGLCFGSDYTKRFLDFNNLDLLVRSHEVKEEGYEVDHDGRCITIFSAPNYCDSSGNMGAFIRFGADCKPKFTKFGAVPHPNIPPMRYANNIFGL